MLERYGYENNLQNPEIHKKGIEAAHKPEIERKRVETNFINYGKDNYGNRQKAKETWLEKYGVPHHRMLEEAKQHMSEVMSSEEVQARRYETMKKNKSFNISKPENEIELILKEKFPDIIRHYSSEKYPFECDFYIPSLDLYIELHFHWTHGGHLFNENNLEDLNKLELWKSKNTKYYNKAIDVWTRHDIKKYNIAKENNLNYRIFYNQNEFKEWFESQ